MVGTPDNEDGLESMARVYVGISNVDKDKQDSNTYRVKRIISVIILFFICFAFSSCGNKNYKINQVNKINLK